MIHALLIYCTLGFWPFLLHFRLYVSSFFLINLLVRSYIKKKKQLLSTTILQRVSKSGEWGARKSRISRHFLEKENGKNIYFFNRQYSLRFGESDWKTRTDYIYQKRKERIKITVRQSYHASTLWSYQPRKETWREKFLKNYSVWWSRSILSIINWPLSITLILECREIYTISNP